MPHARLLRLPRCLFAALAALALFGAAAEPTAPARAEKQLVVSANPYASEAGLRILRAGGGAVDAAIAVQLVLTLVGLVVVTTVALTVAANRSFEDNLDQNARRTVRASAEAAPDLEVRRRGEEARNRQRRPLVDLGVRGVAPAEGALLPAGLLVLFDLRPQVHRRGEGDSDASAGRASGVG